MFTGSYDVYDILGIDRNADKKTIKRAYAALVKQYHPEEHPEEWKRIHDAYEFAMHNISELKRGTAAYEPIDVPEPKQAPSMPAETAPMQGNEAEEPDDIFANIEAAAYKQREEAKEEYREKLETFIQKIQLQSLNKKFRTEDWRKYFEQETLFPIVSSKRFLKELGDCFYLKQIDNDLYTYLNERLDVIAEYIKEYGSDWADGKDLSTVKYARSRIEFAYKYRQSVIQKRQERIKGVIYAAVYIGIMVLISLMLSGQKHEERRQKELGEEYLRKAAESIERQTTTQDIINENPEESTDVDTGWEHLRDSGH